MNSLINGNKFAQGEHVFLKGKACEVVGVTQSFSGPVAVHHYDLKWLSDGSFFYNIEEYKITSLITEDNESDKEEDDAIKPDHYKIGELTAYKVIQAISNIYPAGLGFYVGNIIKYVFRAPRKNGVEDLKKAREYLDQLIEGYEES